jgi:hypothetical protein
MAINGEKQQVWLTLDPEQVVKLKIYCLTHGYKTANELLNDVIGDFLSHDINKKAKVKAEDQKELDELLKEIY